MANNPIAIRKYDETGRQLIREYLSSCKVVVDLGCNEERIREYAIGYDLYSQYGLATDFNKDFLDKVVSGFDGICLSHLLEHIIDTRRFLRACFDRLPPGGRIAIICPDGETAPPETLGDASLSHECLFTAKTLGVFLKHAGFIGVIAEYYERPYAYQQTRGVFAAGEKA